MDTDTETTAIAVHDNVTALRGRLMIELTKSDPYDDSRIRKAAVMEMASALSLVLFGHQPHIENLMREAARKTWEQHLVPNSDQAAQDFAAYLPSRVGDVRVLAAVFSDRYIAEQA